MWLQCVCVVCWGCLSLLSGGTEDELMSSILTSPSPGDHDDYWHALYRLVLKGRLSEARDLLSHHPITHLMPQVTQLLQGERSVLPKNSGFTLMFILVELCVWFVELKKLKLSTPPTHTHPHTHTHTHRFTLAWTSSSGKLPWFSPLGHTRGQSSSGGGMSGGVRLWGGGGRESSPPTQSSNC